MLAFVGLLLLAIGCEQPNAVPVSAVAGSVNKQVQGDFLLKVFVSQTRGTCIEGYPSMPCVFNLRFELCVRVPDGSNRYEPVSAHPEVQKMLEKQAGQLIWSGGEMLGKKVEPESNGKSKKKKALPTGPMELFREKEFKHAIYSGRGYSLSLSSTQKVNLHPLSKRKAPKEILNLSTRFTLQCADCDGTMPPIIEAGTHDSWW